MFTLREDTDCDTHDLINCQCTRKGLNQILPELDDCDFDLDDDRDCHVGTSNKKKETHKTVDQLMDWQHYGRPFNSRMFEVTGILTWIFLIFLFAKSFYSELLNRTYVLNQRLKTSHLFSVVFPELTTNT